MKVALIQCPVWGTREPPLGLVQLSGTLKSKGFEVKSFDLNNFLYRSRSESFKNLWAWEQSMFWYQKNEVKEFFKDFKNLINKSVELIFRFDPKVIGFSVSASAYWASCEMARLLKEIKRDFIIIFGGQTFFNPTFIGTSFKDSPVEYVIAGDGELTFIELLRLLERGEDVSGCLGIHLKSEQNQKVIFTGNRNQMKNLDNLPFMDFSDLKIDDYDDTVHLALMASRGCIWDCAFCSSKRFWPGYRWMSGERIHQEVSYHRMQRNNLGHVDFMDLVFNGNIERVIEFCNLMIKYPPFPSSPPIKWVANAIISPKLTAEVLHLMAAAGCKKLIFGIESGSERVLDLMHKPHKIEIAKRIIKDVWAAGIQVTCNFMFGFPGEEEQDFQKTLDFVKEVGGYLERVYPSRTYCALEEFSYFYEHPEEFNIKIPFSHHLYWETIDGENTYPVRLERCRRFEELCEKLKIKVDCGVKTSVDLDNWFNLGQYYEFKGNYDKAIDYYLRYLHKDLKNKVILEKLESIYEQKTENISLESKEKVVKILNLAKKQSDART